MAVGVAKGLRRSVEKNMSCKMHRHRKIAICEDLLKMERCRHTITRAHTHTYIYILYIHTIHTHTYIYIYVNIYIYTYKVMNSGMSFFGWLSTKRWGFQGGSGTLCCFSKRRFQENTYTYLKGLPGPVLQARRVTNLQLL